MDQIEKPPTRQDVLDTTLPLLLPLAAKVARVHGAHDPRLVEVNEVCDELLDGIDDETATQEAMRRLRELSDGYVAPDWACASYRRLLSTLQRLEADLTGAEIDGPASAPVAR